ncbi:hypothetical protein Y032_0001g490 [Ancylostoma ceylanicum]|uniref:N-acetyltransferase domain-containing protein n=1 Tax=Ancylostoma ceylanicum TaxID=53326 RepID=A0A016W4W0_9BILA|nr:hypothetical protein Y032_0001g490 [Ancylostoma ceylanicum]
MQRLSDDDVQIVRYGTPELWDQMRELVRTLSWTTQDEAMWQLIPEMKNTYPIFAIRKSDNYLLGGVTLVETDIVYGAFYVLRPDLRGLGVGMKMMAHLIDVIAKVSKLKPVLGRGVPAMIEKYSGPPFYAIHHHEMYGFTLSRKELLQMFPCSSNTLVPKSVKTIFGTFKVHRRNQRIEEVRNMLITRKRYEEMNAEQFDKFCAYDHLASGRDRREFLKDHHSLFFTKGVALLDAAGNVHGIAGAVPTLHNPKLFKIAPVFAATQENACYLIKCITDMIQGPDVKFVLHVSTNTAGDWILKKCRDANIPLVFTGTAANSTYNGIIYKDPCNAELMFVPMNCPIYFDR